MSTLPTPDPSLCVRALSELTPRPIDWLWPGRLALGKLAILEGDPGLGKSVLALDLCARLTTGRPFPDGTPGPGPANVVIFTAEDNLEDTVIPRLQVLGGDVRRAFISECRGPAGLDPLRFPSQVSLLEQTLALKTPALVVIDPIKAFLDRRVVCTSDHSVRHALWPLVSLADRYRCAVLMHRHLNKSGGTNAAYRGSDSIAFLAVCRSGWLAAPDPEQPDRCVLAQVKNNLAPPQPSLAYQVVRQDNTVLALNWLGPVPWTSAQLLAGAGAAAAPAGPRDRAREFIEAFLADGPRTSREIWDAARAEGLSERTLSRAKGELGVRSQWVSTNGRPTCYWLLRGQQLLPTDPVQPAPYDLEPWLAPLREQFPPSTPLDNL